MQVLQVNLDTKAAPVVKAPTELEKLNAIVKSELSNYVVTQNVNGSFNLQIYWMYAGNDTILTTCYGPLDLLRQFYTYRRVQGHNVESLSNLIHNYR